MRDETHYKLYQEPLALLKSMGPFSAASKALVESPSSSISEKGVKQEEKNAKTNSQVGAKISGTKASKALSESISRPENQHGKRSSPKFNQDTNSLFEKIKSEENILKILESLEK